MIAGRRAGWLALAALGGLLAAPAGALESASGVYEGKVVCKGLENGGRVKTKQDIEIAILDDGAGGVDMLAQPFGTFGGFLLTDTKKPETGTLSALSCTLGLPGLFGSALHADLKVKAGSVKASLKATLVFMMESGDEATLCQVKAQRISSQAPMIVLCP
jgi:hypothetical protein